MGFELERGILLRELRRGTNGGVSEAMARRGIVYGVNYGVSVVSVREEAARYAPDHEFAKALFRDNVRELCLAATYIADPAMISRDELGFWASGIVNSEVAEHVAGLVSRRMTVNDIVDLWLDPGIPLQCYAALLGLTRWIARGGVLGSKEHETICRVLPIAMTCDNPFVRQGAGRLGERLSMIVL